MDTKSQLQKIAQLKSSANLVLPEMDNSASEVSTPATVPKQGYAPARTDIPDFIFNNGLGRFDVRLAEEYVYADMPDLKTFEKLWTHLSWRWNKHWLKSPLTREEKAQVRVCISELGKEMVEYRNTKERGGRSADRNDLFNRIAIVLNWVEGGTGGKLPLDWRGLE
ncbi:hypothetical protein ASPCAL07767 [Aspergillus calidoustus]|uniref:Uncharacterized protein n=1 Tax=Aspergillus calidoustus TaxID=454130 RepID=A0A0U5CPK9_ASPCI|nr:hypothetical protein ASPCAL07767 [Aspergillus calidoustus]